MNIQNTKSKNLTAIKKMEQFMISLLLKLGTTYCNSTNQIKIGINHNLIKISVDQLYYLQKGKIINLLMAL